MSSLNTVLFLLSEDLPSEKEDEMDLLKKISRNLLVNYASKEEVAFKVGTLKSKGKMVVSLQTGQDAPKGVARALHKMEAKLHKPL